MKKPKTYRIIPPPLEQLQVDMKDQGEEFFDTAKTRRDIDIKWGDSPINVLTENTSGEKEIK